MISIIVRLNNATTLLCSDGRYAVINNPTISTSEFILTLRMAEFDIPQIKQILILNTNYND